MGYGFYWLANNNAPVYYDYRIIVRRRHVIELPGFHCLAIEQISSYLTPKQRLLICRGVYLVLQFTRILSDEVEKICALRPTFECSVEIMLQRFTPLKGFF
jgi:hypothetical protein